MTTIKAIRLASVVTAINILVASGFSIVGIIRPQYLLPGLRSNASIVDIGDVCGGAHNSSSFVRIGGDLQAGDTCVADPGRARRYHAIAGCRNRSV
jgi:hypothetical protein